MMLWRSILLCLLLPAVAVAAPSLSKGIIVGKESYQSGGRRIEAETFFPGDQARHPAVLVLYGSGGSLIGEGELKDFSKRLAAAGMVVFIVHYFNRTRTLFVLRDDTIVKMSGTWAAAVRDGVDHVAAHPRVAAGPIGLFGYSLGAYLAVAESSTDPRIGAVVERSGGILDPWRGKIHHLPPLLILHGKLDQRVSVQNATELHDTARRIGVPNQMHVYEKEGHQFSKAALADSGARAIAFLKHFLHLP